MVHYANNRIDHIIDDSFYSPYTDLDVLHITMKMIDKIFDQ